MSGDHTQDSSPHVETIPDHVSSLTECAEWQISKLKSTAPSSTVIEDCLDDGFLLCDLTTVRQKLQAFERMFPNVMPYYAIKCNPDPMVVSQLPAFDCASLAELQLAKRHSQKIVYANPQRAEHDLDMALEMFADSCPPLTFDGEEEVRKIHTAWQKYQRISSVATTKPPPLILRLLVPDHESTVPLGEKFGANLSEAKSLVTLATSLSLPVVGVSFHCGSGNHNPQSYVTALGIAKQALDVIKSLVPEIPENGWVVDMGGGYPGRDGFGGERGRFGSAKEEQEETTETAAQIAEAVNPALKRLFSQDDVDVIAEPGRYFVEAAFILCSRIYRVKTDENGHRHYYIAHGVQGVFKDRVLCDETFTPLPLFPNAEGQVEQSTSTVYGPSGDSFDVICPEITLPVLQVGDWLMFDRMGAYTLSIAARSVRPPVLYVQSNFH